MFGYVVANTSCLEDAEKERYHAAYCGLCREIGARSGQGARMTLTYDLVFLLLLLSSLYEPEEQAGSARCAVHPSKPQTYFTNRCTAYAADLNVYLACYKQLDDWHDEKRLASRLAASALKKPCAAIEAAWPRQCAAIRENLKKLSRIELSGDPAPDEAINCFGALMGELFVYDERDFFAGTLRALGSGLGRFVYLMDAALDYEKDGKRGAYNVLRKMDKRPEEMQETLMLLIGEAARAFETLPLTQDVPLLSNILYGGVWQRYNSKFMKDTQEETQKKETAHG